MSAGDLSPFVRDLLDDLRRDGFTLAAWARFLFRAWEQSRATAKANPALTRSWTRTVVGVAAAQSGALALEGLCGDSISARRAAPGALLWMAWASFDCWAHLGMTHAARGLPLQRALGPATGLTLARRGVAGLLIGRLLIGRTATHRYALLAAVAAVISDTTDGLIARRRNEASRLGAYLDAMADLEIWTALTLTLAARRLWPGWLTGLVLLRWLGPFTVAAGSYFGCSRGIAVGSTRVGKMAGVAQVASIGLALAPKAAAQRIAGIRSAVYALTVALMIVALLAQITAITTLQLHLRHGSDTERQL
jgi:CDP-diacylglycerol--glycerol-3-phosphate 3-phosphatidyltransferase